MVKKDTDTEKTFTARCPHCFRPLKICYCRYIKPVETVIKFVFLMHPKEAYKQRTGTGRLAHLSLPGSEIIIGIDFTQNKRLCALLADEKYMPLVLYPGENAWTANGTNAQGKTLKQTLAGRTLLVIVVDATWFCAKKILRLSPNVCTLQKISFRAGYRSFYKFKTQPALECLSTIESCYYLIQELQSTRVCPLVSAEPLMDVFNKMVEFQIQSQQKRIESGEIDRYAASGAKRSCKKKEHRSIPTL